MLWTNSTAQTPSENGKVSFVFSNILIRACWGFTFELSAAKFCSDQGAMRKHSLSYATEEQRRAEQNLANASRILNPQQALIIDSYEEKKVRAVIWPRSSRGSISKIHSSAQLILH